MILLVIGASSDMGMELIENISEKYELIFAHYLHENERLLKLKDALGEKLVLIRADLSVEDEVFRLIKDIKEMDVCPSHIVHFPAPTCKNSKFHKIKWDVYQNEIDISLKSAVLILSAFLPEMAKKQYGRVVFMLSFVIRDVSPAYCSNYVVVKYALLGLLKSLSTEYASKGITVNGISPAWVDTKYIENQPDVLKEKNALESPIGRILRANEVISTVQYLLSDGASCVNGQNIYITCGR